MSATTDKLRQQLLRLPKSADRNPISTGATFGGVDATGTSYSFSNMNVQDVSVHAPLHAGSDNTSDTSEVGAISMESHGSVVDLNKLSNTGMVQQSTEAKPLSDDEENTALEGAGITHQPNTNGKETFEELYFERYPSLHG